MSFAPVPDPKKYFNEKEYQKGYDLIKLAVVLNIILIPTAIVLALYIHICIVSIIPLVIFLGFILFIFGFRKRY